MSRLERVRKASGYTSSSKAITLEYKSSLGDDYLIIDTSEDGPLAFLPKELRAMADALEAPESKETSEAINLLTKALNLLNEEAK